MGGFGRDLVRASAFYAATRIGADAANG